MKTKSFQKYIEKRLSQEKIAEIERQAELEAKIIRSIQTSIAEAMDDYMKNHNVGFNELVRRLDSNPTHVAKIRRGEANLTISSLAHIFALLGKDPQEIFKRRK